PRLLLRLLMWGMANRVVSTRRIEVLARRDVSFIYLAGGQRPWRWLGNGYGGARNPGWAPTDPGPSSESASPYLLPEAKPAAMLFPRLVTQAPRGSLDGRDQMRYILPTHQSGGI
ncbi:MAG: hypothetical protein DRI40_07410, partial [Chloroflexi bacterium]